MLVRKPLIQIAYNATVAKIVGGDDAARDIIANLTSFYVDGYEHMDAYQMGRWDGRQSFFKYSNDVFPAGFAEIAIDELKTKGYEVQRVTRDLPAPLGPERPTIDAFGYTAQFDYQPATVDRLVKHGRMIARVATGGGKSRIARIAHARIGRRTLFLTTRKLLMYQMHDGFVESGYAPGVLGDGEWAPKRDEHAINVAMVKTLALRLKEPDMFDKSADALRQRRIRENTLAFLTTVDLIIAEEAHESGGEEYFTVVNACKNAHYALALTATPFMRDGAEANMRLMARFGRVGIDITEEMLIARGVLARPIFKFAAQRIAAKRLYKTTAWQRAYELGVVENTGRNGEIVHFAVTCAEYGLTVMCLVSRKDHGHLLEDMLRKAGLRCKFIFGETSNETRRKMLTALGKGEIDVLIGSTILDVGVDVPAVGAVALAGAGKAEVQLRQRIGRGLRAKKKGPNVCPVLDFRDEHNRTLKAHADTRLSVIKNTRGFAENLLKPNEDFDLAALGFKKVRTITPVMETV